MTGLRGIVTKEFGPPLLQSMRARMALLIPALVVAVVFFAIIAVLAAGRDDEQPVDSVAVVYWGWSAGEFVALEDSVLRTMSTDGTVMTFDVGASSVFDCSSDCLRANSIADARGMLVPGRNVCVYGLLGDQNQEVTKLWLDRSRCSPD